MGKLLFGKCLELVAMINVETRSIFLFFIVVLKLPYVSIGL